MNCNPLKFQTCCVFGVPLFSPICFALCSCTKSNYQTYYYCFIFSNHQMQISYSDFMQSFDAPLNPTSTTISDQSASQSRNFLLFSNVCSKKFIKLSAMAFVRVLCSVIICIISALFEFSIMTIK